MTVFEDREKGFEKQHALEEKISFEIEARCSKLYGLWAAKQLGLKDANAKTYAHEVVEANLEEPGFDDVLKKVQSDFDEKNITISDNVMRYELEKAFKEAKKQINKDKK